MAEVVVETRDLVKHFPIAVGIVFKREIGRIRAVDGVSLQLHRGETLGVVGESGCGKSTFARLLVGLEDPTSGSILISGEDIAGRSAAETRKARRNIQLVMQDPYTSLNPRMTVEAIIGEPFEIHPEVVPKEKRRARVRELIELVGLNPDHLNRYPHQFSGGQRQRIGIARALALNPQILVCDEPVSALDVSIQAQVINLLESLQDELGLSYIFIAHDLSVVRHIADRVAVMYLGKVVETGTHVDDLRAPDPSVHPGAPVGGAGTRPDVAWATRRDRFGRRRALTGVPAIRLPVQHPLLEGRSDLLRRRAGARRTRCDDPPQRLPLRPGARRHPRRRVATTSWIAPRG